MAKQQVPDQALVVMQLRAVATVAHAIDVDELERFVQAREHAMAIGPILQPTSWLEHGFDADRAIVELARAALVFRKAVDAAADAAAQALADAAAQALER